MKINIILDNSKFSKTDYSIVENERKLNQNDFNFLFMHETNFVDDFSLIVRENEYFKDDATHIVFSKFPLIINRFVFNNFVKSEINSDEDLIISFGLTHMKYKKISKDKIDNLNINNFLITKKTFNESGNNYKKVGSIIKKNILKVNLIEEIFLTRYNQSKKVLHIYGYFRPNYGDIKLLTNYLEKIIHKYDSISFLIKKNLINEENQVVLNYFQDLFPKNKFKILPITTRTKFDQYNCEIDLSFVGGSLYGNKSIYWKRNFVKRNKKIYNEISANSNSLSKYNGYELLWIKSLFKNFTELNFRDQYSVDLLKKIGINANLKKDPVLDEEMPLPKKIKGRLGVSFVDVPSGFKKANKFNHKKEMMNLKNIISSWKGEIVFFSFEPMKDVMNINEIMILTNSTSSKHFIYSWGSEKEFEKEFMSCETIYIGRYHAAILAKKSKSNILGTPYETKVVSLLEEEK